MKIRDKIVTVDIAKLTEYEKNNKNHPEEQISLLVQNIDRFGFTNPVLIDKDNVIIAGHARFKAAQKLNLKTLPCIRIDDLTENEIKALRISDNRLGELAELNYLNLKEEWDFLKDTDTGLEFLTGYSEEDFSSLFEEESKEVEEDDYDVPEDVEKIKTDIEQGDIIKLGNHTLMCGDSINLKHVECLLEGSKADMCFTDPPYLMDFTGGIHADGSKSFNSKHGRIKNDKMTPEEGRRFLDSINIMIRHNVKGAFYITFYRLGISEYFQSLERAKLKTRSLIIWEKGNHTLSNSDYMSRYEPIFYGWVEEHTFYGGNNGMDVWFIDRTQKNELHPTMKPLELCSKAIQDGSREGESVLDLFGGSGSTLIACEQLNRKCYMMELDERYCDVICQRWEKLTGLKREVLTSE